MRPRERLAPGGVLLGRNTASGNLFQLAPGDRRGHMHVPGASGRGKSNFLEVLIRQDILQADGVPRGLALLDWHGAMVRSLVGWLAETGLYKYRTVRVIDPTDPAFAFSLNPFRSAAHFDRAALTDLLVNATVQVWGGRSILETPRLYSILWELYHALAALGVTLCEARDFIPAGRRGGDEGSASPRQLARLRLRQHLIERLALLDEDGADFWDDLESLSPSRRHEYLEPVASRLRPFLRSPYVRRVFGQTGRTLDLARAMDRGEILLINLKGGEHLSQTSARLIGTLLVNEFYTSCFRRRKVGDKEIPFYLYIDECQNFLSPDIARILDESRKFGLYLTLAHQHLGHLREAGEHIYRSVLTNTFTKVVFGGLEPEDAEYMAKVMFRGTFDLQRPKARLMRPAAVGNQLVWVAQEGESRGSAHAIGSSWSQGEAVTTSEATTRSRSRTDSVAHTISHGTSEAEIDTVTEGRSSSHGEQATAGGFLVPGVPTGVSDSQGESTAHSRGRVVTESSGEAFTRGRATTIGTATTRGRAVTVQSQRGGSVTDTVSHQVSRGRSEAYIPRYEVVPGPIWDLQDQIHIKSVSLAHLQIGQAFVRVGSKRPRRIAVPFIGAEQVLPERYERVRRKLLEETPYVAPVAVAEEEYREHRARLVVTAAPPEPEEIAGDEEWT